MPEEVVEKGNPDAAQDESLIQAVLQRDLQPVFEAMGSRLRDLEEDLGETRDLLLKFCEGLIGSADGYKKNQLSEEISSKYGKDLEPFEGFHKDVYGKGLSESLIEELMGDGAPGDEERDGWIKGKLEEAKGKYGKYLGMKDEEEAPAEEAPAEAEGGGAEEIKKGEEEMEGEEEKEGEGDGDPISSIMKQVKSLGGQRHKLSAPVKGK